MGLGLRPGRGARRRAALRGHVQTDGAAAFAGIEQGRLLAGIFPARIKQNAAAARRDRIDAHFQAGIDSLRQCRRKGRQACHGRNSKG